MYINLVSFERVLGDIKFEDFHKALAIADLLLWNVITMSVNQLISLVEQRSSHVIFIAHLIQFTRNEISLKI